MLSIFVLISVALVGVANAKPLNKKLKECAKIKNDLKRLSCYDGIVQKRDLERLKSDRKDITGIGMGKWQIKREISPIDDSITVILALPANRSIKTKFSFRETYPVLIARCQENKTEVYVVTKTFLGSATLEVTTRFDKEPAKTQTWFVSTDHKAVFSPGSGVAYAKKLMRHKKLVIRLIPYGENPVWTSFDLLGTTQAIKPLRKACGW